MHRIATLIVAAVSIALSSGCSPDPEEAELDRIWAGEGDTPLALDPTDRYELDPWWTDGAQLLHLRRDRSYRLYEDRNHYGPALESGRWSHDSYAVLWLEPYTVGSPERRRVGISRSAGRIVLKIGDGAPMIGSQRPPAVLEDRLIGTWKGPGGTLVISADGTYVLSPDEEGPVGHAGAWRVEGDMLVIEPRSPGIGPLSLDIVVAEDGVGLDAAEGRFELATRPDA